MEVCGHVFDAFAMALKKTRCPRIWASGYLIVQGKFSPLLLVSRSAATSPSLG